SIYAGAQLDGRDGTHTTLRDRVARRRDKEPPCARAAGVYPEGELAHGAASSGSGTCLASRPRAFRTRSTMPTGRPSATTSRATRALGGPSRADVSQPAATSGPNDPARPTPTPLPATTASRTAPG